MCIRDSGSVFDDKTFGAGSGLGKLALWVGRSRREILQTYVCLLYTSDAADERSSVDLGGRRIIKKKKQLIGQGQ